MNWNLLNIPRALMELPQWVCVKAGSKAPMQARRKEPASSTGPHTWATFGEATRAVERGWYDNVGFVFRDNGIVGIDIDDGYAPDGSVSAVAADIMRRCRSYTERSRSGRGFHIFVRGCLPFAGKNNMAGVEIYQANRYFIMTGDYVAGDQMIRECQPVIDGILEKYFSEVSREGAGKGSFDRIYSPAWPKRENGKVPLRPDYPAILPGGRNLSLTSLAGQLHSAGYGQEQVRAELLRVNLEACRPPLPAREIDLIVKSVSRYRR